MRLTWLADVLRRDGLEVIELDGWETRGGPLTKVEGVVWHGTITPASTPDANVARLLRDGHSTLKGPLSQLGLDRQGRFWVVAAGRCNHNGFGEWGNQAVGIEAFHDGKEQWPGIQLRAWEQGTAAICRQLGLPCERVKGHRETDPRRKVDPAGLNMDFARRNVAALIEGDDMTAEERQWLATVHHELRHPDSDLNRRLLEIRDGLNLINKGAEGFGIMPTPATVSRTWRAVERLAEKLGVKV